MSYILDALKKADRERSLAKVPTLTTVQLPIHVGGRRAVLWTTALVLTGAGLGAWFLWPSPPQVPAARVEADARTEPPAPVESLTLRRIPKQPVAPPVRLRRPDAAKPVPALPPVASPADPAPRPTPESTVTERPTPMSRPQASEASPPQPTPAAPLPVPAPPTPMPPLRQPDTVPSTGGEHLPLPLAPAPVAPPTVAPSQVSLREASAKLTLDVFVYSEEEKDRMVIISGRRYVKGQLVDELYLLEDITPDGAVLTYQGERIVLRP